MNELLKVGLNYSLDLGTMLTSRASVDGIRVIEHNISLNRNKSTLNSLKYRLWPYLAWPFLFISPVTHIDEQIFPTFSCPELSF